MPDLDDVTDSSEDAPDTPAPAEEESPSEEAAESEGAAEADGEGGEGDEGEGGGTAKAQPSAYEKLLAKYGGDREKMAQSVFEGYNSTARLYERLANIEKYIVGREQPQVDEQKLVQQDPDVQRLVRQFNGVKGRYDDLERTQGTLISEYGKVTNEIQYLKGALSKADIDSKAELQQELRDKTNEQSRLNDRIQTSKERLEDLHGQLLEIAERGKQAEEGVRQKALRQRQQAEAEVGAQQGVRAEFAESVQAEAARYGVDPESKQFRLMFRAINNDIVSYLSKLPDGAPAIDIPAAVEHFMGEYAEAMGLKAKFQKASILKRAATSAPAKAGQAPLPTGVPKPPKDGRWTKEYVEKRARTLLGD